VGVDDVVGCVFPKKRSHLLGAQLIQSGDIHTRQNSSEVRLPAAIAPDLCDGTRASEYGDRVALKNSQPGAEGSVPLVNRYQSTRVKNRAHAAPLRRVVLSAAAAASSSSSLKGASSSSQRSRAAPSSSFLRRCAAAATTSWTRLSLVGLPLRAQRLRSRGAW